MSDITAMGDAGKAMPVPRGRYSDTETYDYLDFVYSGDASYIAKKLTTGNPPAEDNEYWQLFARGGTLTENSDISNTTVTFEQAENRANIFSKDSLKTIMGKISKMYSDLKTVAFSGKYTDLEGRVTVTNNDLATIPGTAWDAVRGAQIRKDLDKLYSDLKKSGIMDSLLQTTSIKDSFTFEDLIRKQSVTFFTNWTDTTNFPVQYGSGIVLPAKDSRNRYIIYTASSGIYYGYYYIDNGVVWTKL